MPLLLASYGYSTYEVGPTDSRVHRTHRDHRGRQCYQAHQSYMPDAIDGPADGMAKPSRSSDSSPLGVMVRRLQVGPGMRFWAVELVG
jgi:hypothetical protein